MSQITVSERKNVPAVPANIRRKQPRNTPRSSGPRPLPRSGTSATETSVVFSCHQLLGIATEAQLGQPQGHIHQAGEPTGRVHHTFIDEICRQSRRHD